MEGYTGGKRKDILGPLRQKVLGLVLTAAFGAMVLAGCVGGDNEKQEKPNLDEMEKTQLVLREYTSACAGRGPIIEVQNIQPDGVRYMVSGSDGGITQQGTFNEGEMVDNEDGCIVKHEGLRRVNPLDPNGNRIWGGELELALDVTIFTTTESSSVVGDSKSED